MTTRQRPATIFLWSALVLASTMFGASVYQRISLIPEWGGDLPQSVVLHFSDKNAGRAIDRFWTSVTAPTAVSVILALILNWHTVGRRRWILRGAILFFVMLAWTALYFVPKGRGVPLLPQSSQSSI